MNIKGSDKTKILIAIYRCNDRNPDYTKVEGCMNKILNILHSNAPTQPIEALKQWIDEVIIRAVDFKGQATMRERLGTSQRVRESVAKLVQIWLNHTTDLPTNPEPLSLPDCLNTPEALKYFAQARELGLIDDDYKWLKGLQLLACFAREMSLKLGLGKGINSNGTSRVGWRPFEALFKIKKGKLRQNYNDIQKTGQQPKGYELIDKIFN